MTEGQRRVPRARVTEQLPFFRKRAVAYSSAHPKKARLSHWRCIGTPTQAEEHEELNAHPNDFVLETAWSALWNVTVCTTDRLPLRKGASCHRFAGEIDLIRLVRGCEQSVELVPIRQLRSPGKLLKQSVRPNPNTCDIPPGRDAIQLPALPARRRHGALPAGHEGTTVRTNSLLPLPLPCS